MLRALLLIINLFKPCMSLICGYIMASYMAYNIERSIKARNFVQLQTVELSVISVLPEELYKWVYSCCI